MDKLYIVMPAYNEAENIDCVVRNWYPYIQTVSPGSRLVVINDGSKDGTLARCRALEAELPQFVVIDQPNSGHGATCLHAYRHAIEQGADYVFQTDSDNQTEPCEMQILWDGRERYDIQVGNRKGRQDGLSRVAVTLILKLVLLLIFGVAVKDANTPFRLISRSALERYLRIIPDDFFLANALMSTIAVYQKDRIRWVNISFHPRSAGTNSINLRRIFKIGLKALSDFSMAKKRLVAGGLWYN